MLAQVAGMIEAVGLQAGAIGCDLGQSGFGQNLLRDIVDRAAQDFMNEADVSVFAGGDARDHLSSRVFGTDDGFTAAASILDRQDEILYPGFGVFSRQAILLGWAQYFCKSEYGQE
jgi:hypothetical protein